ncbi:uncharacterized protein LOC135376833, partial [Ornithodoros turicata]|uniref:uncharacterized protein LOC135376833 n=1 Tax=Ornithodoros turicata TaxID=34597 RepID=UPI00313A17F2
MDRVKYNRATRRAQVTKLCNEVAELRADRTATDVTLKALLSNIQNADVALRAVNDEIEPLFGAEELEEEYQGAISYEEKTVKAIVEIQSRLDELRLDPAQSQSGVNPVQPQSGVNPVQSQSGVKLPKLQLQTFSEALVIDYQRRTVHDAMRSESFEANQDGQGAAQSESTAETETKGLEELKRLLIYLRVEIESREQVATKIRRDSYPDQRPKGKRTGGMTAAAVLYAGLGQPGEKRNCFFCSAADHSTEDCKADITLAERFKKLAKDTRCYRCTKKGHRSKDCRVKVECSKCRRRHASSVCDPSRQPVEKALVSEVVTTTSVSTTNNPQQCERARVMLQTFRAWASSDTECAYLRGIFDGGSRRTFIRDDIARRLKLPVIGQTTLQLNTFAGDASRDNIRKCKVVEVRLRSQFAPKEYVVRATTIDFICKDLEETPASNEFVSSVRVHGNFIADDFLFPSVRSEGEIGLLIGCDELWKLVSGEVKRCKSDGRLVAIESVFGWTFQGPTTVTSYSTTDSSTTAVCILKVGVVTSDDDILKRFWELDNLGISQEPDSKQEHNAEVLEDFIQKVERRNGRYEVALPWKMGLSALEDNYAVAKDRVRRLMKRLQRDNTVLEYDEAIRSYIKNGHAEEVKEDNGSSLIYYMPHRAVIRNNSSTTRVRVVFDASSHAAGALSLNDHLEKGPKLNTDLVGVLLRFRLHKVALTADIEKAFLQVGVRSQDRDALRFLWLSEIPTADHQDPQLQCWRMKRVPFGTTASPFLLSATLQHHFKSFLDVDGKLAESLLNSFYVDDLLTGAPTVDEALDIAYRAQEILLKDGMNLTKWASNAAEIQQALSPQDISCGVKRKSFNEPAQGKMLGVVWNRELDTFTFSGEHLLSIIRDTQLSKRSVLQASARIFDPLGFISPYTIRVKVIFQELWNAGLQWDAPLPADLATMWRSWISELPKLCSISLERCLLPVNGTEYVYELHVFTDASPQAYGACAFLRTKNECEEKKVRLIFAKTRVAPIKTLTLPRLELMGAVIGVRIANFVRSSLAVVVKGVTFWTDSTIALSWIKGDATRWRPFVRNRVVEIQVHSEAKQWRHCPGSENPADALTRGLTVKKLIDERQWFEGPGWLTQNEELWPDITSRSPSCLDSVEDERRTETVTMTNAGESPIPALFDLSRHSNYQRALRITAWITRFIRNCRSTSKIGGSLSATEIGEAEDFWTRHVQTEAFPEEITALKEKGAISNTSKIAQWRPFLDDNGILRLTGRLQYSNHTEGVKHPILLPKQHAFVALLADNAHRRMLHGGVQSSLTALRERWWIIKARQLCCALCCTRPEEVHQTCIMFRTSGASHKVCTDVRITLLTTKAECPSEHSLSWKRQPEVNKMAAGNILLSGTILFNGTSAVK